MQHVLKCRNQIKSYKVNESPCLCKLSFIANYHFFANFELEGIFLIFSKFVMYGNFMNSMHKVK